MDERCKLKLGDTVELIPGYAPITVHLYDAYYMVEQDVVVDIWPIVPRGLDTEVLSSVVSDCQRRSTIADFRHPVAVADI